MATQNTVTKATQRDAIAVLTKLAALDLPSIGWHADPPEGSGLEGQPWNRVGESDKDLADLAEWGEHFGVDVVVKEERTYTSHTVTATVDGVPVKLYTHTNKTHTYISVPIEQAAGSAA